MEISRTSFRNIKRALVTFIVMTIIFSTSTARRQTSRFSLSVFKPFDFETEKEQEFSETLSRVKRQATLPQCKPGLTCNSPTINRFRTFDGTCNNVARPFCGATEIPFIRWLPRSPPGQGLRCPLCPKPRNVSTTISNILPSGQSDGVTVMLMQWGQFIDHDFVSTPTVTDNTCCQDFQTPTGSTPECLPIDVTGDPFYSGLSTTVNCLPFVRSTAATCQVGTTPAGSDRQNINDLTAYLDGSAIYGSSETVANSLRTFSRGQLQVSGSEIEPPCSGDFDVCPRSLLPEEGTPPQFFAGDARVEQLPGLTSLHTLFLRLHNWLAFEFNCPGDGFLGPDEVTYQITRKLVIALLQHITYSEFLPLVLGPNLMSDYELDVYNGYNANICATTPNVFAAAAFRFGHSMVPNQFNTINGPILLEENFNNHGVTHNPNSHPSHFIHSMINQVSLPMDHRMTDALRNFLFAAGPSFEFGEDLFSRNIKRGRDHGIPDYLEWFKACVDNPPNITTFAGLLSLSIMPPAVVNAFDNLYNGNVKNIDLFPAGIAEFGVPGGIIGPTFGCIIAEHFANLKYGDRFWFERPGFFTPQQIASIKRTKLSSIICLLTAVDSSQINVMEFSDEFVPCSTILEDGVLDELFTTAIWNDFCFQ